MGMIRHRNFLLLLPAPVEFGGETQHGMTCSLFDAETLEPVQAKSATISIKPEQLLWIDLEVVRVDSEGKVMTDLLGDLRTESVRGTVQIMCGGRERIQELRAKRKDRCPGGA